ncbi:MAG: hypothetical protein RIR77_961 [Planctomycetota bacterium]|jgi:hypothetical protein
MGTEHPHTTWGTSHRWHLLPLIAVVFPLVAWFVLVGAPAISDGEHIGGPLPDSETAPPPSTQDPRRVPATGFRGQLLLQSLPPGSVGTLVNLAPADYRYVPLLRDDVSDVRIARLLWSIVEGRFGEPLGEELDGCGPAAAEFAIYLAGRSLAESRNLPGARATWHALLAMPPADRVWRSTWAAFMIGRSYQYDDPEEAIRWFRRTRELAAEGFADSLGLANSSIGWEACAELDLHHHPRAIRLYLEHKAAGDPTSFESLGFASRWALRAPMETLVEYARDPVMRPVITDTAERLIYSYPLEYAKPTRDRWRQALVLADAAQGQR